VSFATIPEILDELRLGKMVVIVDDEDRENEGDLIMAADCVRPEDINFMSKYARGLICLSLSRERCAYLNLPLMVADNQSPYQTAFTLSIEATQGVSTGISAFDRAHTIRTAVGKTAVAADLRQPGHVFPLMAKPGGVLVRAGHTEAAGDLAQLAGFSAAGVLVEILSDDGRMARRAELESFAATHAMKIGTIADLIRYRLQTERSVRRIRSEHVQIQGVEFVMYQYEDDIGGGQHHALVLGQPNADEVIPVRVHAVNWRRDVLGISDGATDLRQALRQIISAGKGVAVVLAGLQDATKALTGAWRDNGIGAQILRDVGVQRLRIIGTSRRYVALQGFGLEVVE
jgi:3,4-dihydroxy 2-butanone 4-phosphate synthase / GTP cyclohydrolase II